jgi:hypothetical protein
LAVLRGTRDEWDQLATLKSAKALGLAVLDKLLAVADEVIE